MLPVSLMLLCTTAQGDPALLGLLDLRGGYTPAEVAATLAAWGQQGRLLYLAVELIDVTVYCSAYRGVLLVLGNRWVQSGWMGWQGGRMRRRNAAATLAFVI